MRFSLAIFVLATGVVMAQPPQFRTTTDLIVIDATVVGRDGFPVAAQESAREAARRVVDRAEPSDRLAIIAMPGPLTIGPTRDHALIRNAIADIGGKRVDAPRSKFNISGSEAAILKGRSSIDVSEIIGRECRMDAMNPQCKWRGGRRRPT